MPEPAYGNLSFAEQIGFFRNKLDLPTATWRDIRHAEHDVAFVVAGATKRDLLADLRGAVDKAVSQGTTLEQFRKDFDAIVARRGWTGWTGSDSAAGRAWRTSVIYETNLRTSYAAGRLAQQKAIADRRPYWRYRHSGAQNPREQHLAWDGKILRHDDPWWNIHYPPNGWGCGCRVETLADRDLQRLGRPGPDAAPTAPDDTQGIGDGWAYTPGRSRLRGVTPEPADAPVPAPPVAQPPTDAMPGPRTLSGRYKMAADRPAGDYVDAFLNEFSGRGPEGGWHDVIGETLMINDQLFRDGRGQLKVGKRGRAPYARVLARTVIEPDEIWVRVEERRDKPGTYMVRRRYLARWLLPGEDVPALAVFDAAGSAWSGTTAFAGDDDAYLQRQRGGVRLYKRGEE